MSKTTTIAISPVAKGRPRFSKNGHPYTPSSTRIYEKKLSYALLQIFPLPLEGPITLKIHFYLHRPQRLMRKKDHPGPVPHDRKPDLDNLLKAFLDAASGILWRDDGQICQIDAAKSYTRKLGEPRIEFAVSLLERII